MNDHDPDRERLDLLALRIAGYVAESAILVLSAHKILNSIASSLRETNDSAEADYILSCISKWNEETRSFAETYGKIGYDVSALKKQVAN